MDRVVYNEATGTLDSSPSAVVLRHVDNELVESIGKDVTAAVRVARKVVIGRLDGDRNRRQNSLTQAESRYENGKNAEMMHAQPSLSSIV
jgi:hypothetical protein